MPSVQANGIRIEYDTFGDPDERPLLLVSGGGSQMTRWPEDFCNMLVDCGHHVIRFDNRDVGLSTHFDEAGVPDIAELLRQFQAGETPDAAYSLEDMAADAIGLLDELGIPAAHVCGQSLGGMIAQVMAINYPDRVLTMTAISSTTGNPELPTIKPERRLRSPLRRRIAARVS